MLILLYGCSFGVDADERDTNASLRADITRMVLNGLCVLSRLF